MWRSTHAERSESQSTMVSGAELKSETSSHMWCKLQQLTWNVDALITILSPF